VINTVLISEFPRIELPDLDVIGEPNVRAAVEHRVDTYARVREGHDVNGRLQAGHRLDDYSPEQIADFVKASRDGDGLLAEATGQFREALAAHHGAWRQDAAKRADKARAATAKAARAALEALAEYERQAGTVAMLDASGAELMWRRPADSFEIGGAQNALRALLARLDATEQQ
jgi:hypothetical protein